MSGRELAIYSVHEGDDTLRTVNLFGNGATGRVNVNWSPKEVEDKETGEPMWITVRLDDPVYYVKDHLGSIRATLNTSGTTVFAQNTYPYGEIVPGQSYEQSGNGQQRYDFTGKERDVESGLNYFGARYYDSELGRWLSVDPLMDKYPGWSSYNYCANSPIRKIDPNGKYHFDKIYGLNMFVRISKSDLFVYCYGGLVPVLGNVTEAICWAMDDNIFDKKNTVERIASVSVGKLFEKVSWITRFAFKSTSIMYAFAEWERLSEKSDIEQVSFNEIRKLKIDGTYVFEQKDKMKNPENRLIVSKEWIKRFSNEEDAVECAKSLLDEAISANRCKKYILQNTKERFEQLKSEAGLKGK